MFTFAVSDVCEAFNGTHSLPVVGTKVTDPGAFWHLLSEAMESYDASKDRVPGQHFVTLGEEALATVSAGVGRHTNNPLDYVVRSHRGRCGAFLKRPFAALAEGVAAVVYTLEAYRNDPEVNLAEMTSFLPGTTHVVVAVLAFAGPRATLSPYRFVSNLAGGNNEALTYTADDMRRMAVEIKDYDDEWCTVAD